MKQVGIHFEGGVWGGGGLYEDGCLDEMKWRGRDIKTNITEWSSEDLK
jgi:hypothetical protein